MFTNSRQPASARPGALGALVAGALALTTLGILGAPAIAYADVQATPVVQLCAPLPPKGETPPPPPPGAPRLPLCPQQNAPR